MLCLDLRVGSPGFGKTFSIELSAENRKQIFIPRGFAHGFSVLSETALIAYKCDQFYNKQSESGILYNDTLLNIDWQIPSDKALVSQKGYQICLHSIRLLQILFINRMPIRTIFRIVVTGSNGQLGKELARVAINHPQFHFTFLIQGRIPSGRIIIELKHG